MNISIVSQDKRYIELNKILSAKGFNSKICQIENVGTPNVLILSVRRELSDSELKELLSKIPKTTLVLSGYESKIKEYFDGRVVDYSSGESFLEKNAYLTAEATVSVLHSLLERSIKSLKIFVCGYGRIGKHLCRIFSSLGAKMYVYARREEVRAQIEKDGYISKPLEYSSNCDLVLNTVPSIIYTKKMIDKLPTNTCIVELASKPGGFEDTSRVYSASGLPGKIFPKSSAEIIFDTIEKLFP
ncbi:MAG: hypothetical protein IJ400_00980 [Clostridia bacterium]|nr:hypothetical protein [Clostridia bacterium]